MFEQSILCERSRRRPAAMLLSIMMQTFLLSVALLIPLILGDALPAVQLSRLFVLPPLPVVRAAAPLPQADPSVRRSKVKRTATNVFRAPTEIPSRVARIVEDIEVDPHLAALANQLPWAESAAKFPRNGIPGLNLILGAPKVNLPPPPVREGPVNREIKRIRRGGTVVEALALSRPGPLYPELAKRARVQGDVLLQAVIAVDGSIKELRVQTGHPFLIKAAVDAVSQWRYRPTTLNGDPVEVITQITVTFRLR